MKTLLRRTVVFASLAIATISGGLAQASPVLDLALVIDASGSISTAEFNLQINGYANAFESSAIQNLITQTGSAGGVRVTAILFATTATVAIDWTTLTNATEADAFATAFRAITRSGIGSSTSIARGLELANQRLAALTDAAGKRIIDVSGDGQENVLSLAALHAQRNAALNTNNVDQINGLVIGSEALRTYYVNNVIGGTNSFAVRVADFQAFEAAIHRKLEVEIGSVVPEPSSIALLGMGLAGGVLAALRRRTRIAA